MLRRGLLCLAVPLLIAGRLEAQHLKERINDLFTFGNCGQPLCLDGSINQSTGHGLHFLPAASASNGSIIQFITDAVGTNASNIPISSASSGFTFKFVGGVPVKSAQSSGPVFGERAQTLGRGRFLMGGNVTGIRFKTIRGVPLDNINLNFTHQDIGNPGLGDPTFENDVINVRMSLYLNLFVSSFFVTYGLFDKMDVSVSIPVVHTSLEGRSVAQILPFGTPALHFFGGTSADPILRASAATFGSATGVGDIAGRIKLGLVSHDHFGMALLTDVRFPTGDEDQLLGAGKYSARGLAVFSSRFGQFAPHLNLGYLYREGTEFNDAFLATGGFDQALNSWTTLAADVISEWQIGESKLQLPGPVQYVFPFARTVDPIDIPSRKDNHATASLGFKFKTGAATIVTNALIPLLHGGLEPNVAWTTGLEFNF